MTPVVGSDREALRALSRQVTKWRLQARLNKAQINVLATRLSVVVSTLLAMPDSAPAPQLLSVVRSGEFLLRLYAKTDPTDLLLRHFAGRHLFAALRQRYEQVWSLHSTVSWDDEDRRAFAADEAACFDLLGESRSLLDRHDSRFGDDVVTLFFRRRGGVSGWKLPRDHLRFRPSVCLVESLSTGLPPPETAADRPDTAVSFQRFTGVHTYASSAPVEVLELPPDAVTPEQLDVFLVDVAHRHAWCHPCLVPLLGGYTEAFNDDGQAYLVLGAVLHDFVFDGWEPLAEQLFVRRARPSLHTALHVCLQVADALQYVLFDAANVPPEVVRAWCSVSPWSVYVQEVASDELPPEVDFLFGDRTIQTRFLPQFAVAGHRHRWAPPADAVCTPCYAVASLLMAMLTASPAHAECLTQRDLRAAESQPNFPAHPPPFVPSSLHRVCCEGLAQRGSGRRGFRDIQEMRRALLAVRAQEEGLVDPEGRDGFAVLPRGSYMDYGL